jgi:hypothetical protein
MATSPNYAWAEPDNSSLVKNGAADIRTLGDAIDTSVWNVGYGQAGKNKIINGDFGINQRAFTSNTTNGIYNFDRWFTGTSGGTQTVTPQTFTLGTAPVAGYEGKTYVQSVTASQTLSSGFASIQQKIESVRTFAGQPVTVSFWAKADTGTPKVGLSMQQAFGSGGSPSAAVRTAGNAAVTLSTSWARYSINVTVPSISGKTVGTTDDGSLNVQLWQSLGADYTTGFPSGIGLQNFTLSLWGVQVEYGSKATPFQTATGTLQGELAACQRYYVRFNAGNGYGNVANSGYTVSATQVNAFVLFPTQLRTIPTSIDSANISYLDTTGTTAAVTSPSSAASGVNFANVQFATTGATGARYCWFRDSAGAGTGYLGFSAEL